jgi:hypothetical protein
MWHKDHILRLIQSVEPLDTAEQTRAYQLGLLIAALSECADRDNAVCWRLQQRIEHANTKRNS